MPSIETIFLYRMTHIKNIPHILDWGITHRSSPNANPAFIPIGDLSLITLRENKTVSVDNGDRTAANRLIITLGNYIPFYFGIKMPMLYVMQLGGNFVHKPTSPKEIVYLACPVSKVIQLNKSYYFSDGHATDNFTTFYDSTSIADLASLIDWEAVKAPYWGGQDNLNIKRKKQAEFLIEGDLPPNCIGGIACYNEEAKQELAAMKVDTNIIKVKPEAYY